MTIGSLFSGIGGLDLGLESCGLGPVLWQAESDPFARAVLAKHWPGVHCYEDVRQIDHEAPPVDIICGGFPCQDISLAGAGAGIDGPRSGLWREYARIVRVLRPSVVFVENVGALVVRGLDRVLGDLAALGYDAEWETFLASDVGAPHRRERLFLLAYADRERVRQLAERDQRGGGRVRATERGDAQPVHDCQALADAVGAGRTRADRRPTQAGWMSAVRGGDEGAVANPDRARCNDAKDPGSGGGDALAGPEAEGWRSSRGVEPERTGSGDVANAHGGRCEGERRGGLLYRERAAFGNDPHGRHRPHRFPPGPSEIAGWDGPQPAIRKCHDGPTRGLDGALDGSNTKRGPSEELRALRESVPENSLQRRTGRRLPVREAPLLLEGVLGASPSAGVAISFSDAEANRQEEEAVLREVRRAVSTQQSPQGSGLAEQRPLELGNALLILSHLVASRSGRDPSVNASVAVFCLWKAVVSARALRNPPDSLQAVWRPETDEEASRWILEACLGYLGVDRADRLRLLGNAVVPQQAALAWRTLTTRALGIARSATKARAA